MKRVGRYTDKCIRIQDKAFPEIDLKENATRKGKISEMINKLEKAIKTEKPSTGEPVRPASDRKERNEEYRKTKLDEQNKLLEKIEEDKKN